MQAVILGPLKSENLKKYFDWRNNYKIWKWCRQNSYLNELHHKEWFDHVSDDPKIKMFEIIDRDENETVGVCGLTDIDLINRRAEFSIYIGPEYHGQNYGELGLRALIHHGFMHFGLNSIFGETFELNKSAAIFERVGMKLEGIRREYYYREGRFINAKIYSILRSEWVE